MKSILLHVYEDTALQSRVEAACDLARAVDGHITCLHATPFEDYLATDPLVVAALSEEFSEKMKRRRQEVQQRVESELAREGVLWDWIHVDSLMSDALVRFSPLADAIVVSQADGAVLRDEPRPVAGAIATAAKAPVLVVPQSSRRFDAQAPALIAWNASPEAAMAVKAAVPLLRLAASVSILAVRDRQPQYPSDSAARYLSRHGIEAELLQRPVGDGTSETLVATARELGSGLIVMGAYGHSRLRETLLGGVTREMLQTSPLPLLLAH